jgi:hypothetical protein
MMQFVAWEHYLPTLTEESEMGFFSWNCKGCGESIKAPYDIPTSMLWQNQAVALMPNGTIVIGQYDGYGKMTYEAAEIPDDGVEWWHYRCWCDAKKPNFTGASDYSHDQGFFYDDPEE